MVVEKYKKKGGKNFQYGFNRVGDYPNMGKGGGREIDLQYCKIKGGGDLGHKDEFGRGSHKARLLLGGLKPAANNKKPDYK